MVFQGGSVVGDVVLDVSPLRASVAEAKAMVKGLRADTVADLNLKFNASLGDRGRAVFESVRTPAEKYAQTQRELDVLLHSGTISETTYARALKQSAAAAEAAAAAGAKRGRGLAGMDYATLLRGAGALTAATIVLNKFDSGMDEISATLAKVERGSMTSGQAWGHLTDKLITAVPVMGQTYSITRKLVAELDGTAAAARKAAREFQQLQARQQHFNDSYKEMKQIGDNAMAAAQSIGRSLRLGNADSQSPGEKIRLQATFDYADADAALKQMRTRLAQMQGDPSVTGEGRGRRAIARLQTDIDAYQRKAQEAFANAQKQASEADFAPIGDLQKQVRQFNMTPIQKQFDELRVTLAGRPELLDQANKALDELRSKQVGSIFTDLQSQLAAIDMTPLEAKFESFRRANKLLDTDELTKAKNLLAEIDVKSKIKDALESIRSPMDKYKETLNELRGWKDEGRITAEQFGTLNARARKDAFGDTKLPGLIRSGSGEAQALRYDQSRNSGQSSDNYPKQQLEEQKKTTAQLVLVAGYVEQQLTSGGEIELVGL